MWSSNKDIGIGIGEIKMSNNNNINNDSYNTTNDTIPYHARENSLPFSYGQITKSPTSLRRTAGRLNYYRNNDIKNDYDFNCNTNLSLDQPNNNFGVKCRDVSNTNINCAYNLLEENKVKYVNIDNNNKWKYTEQNDKNRYIYKNNDIKFNDLSLQVSNGETDENRMIKTQPRLTSPLLVRKTLNNNSSSTTTTNNNNNKYNNNYNIATFNSSRSPTRSTTNTIANTYHYSYGNKSDSFDKFNVNSTNRNNYCGDNHDHFNSINTTPNYNYSNTSNEILRKTPTRYEFEELLRERREKVFNEYSNSASASAHDLLSTSSANTSPISSRRRFTNGTVQLPSTLINTTRQSYVPKVYGRSHSSQSHNYNYDFEFNLNLDDNDVDVNDSLYSMRRPKAIDTLSQRQPQKQMLTRPKYETTDIPLTSTYVEHSFHTVSSASPSKNYANKNYAIHTTTDTIDTNATKSNSLRESAATATAYDIYSKQYHEEQKYRPPSAETATMTMSNTLQSKRSNYNIAYNNDNHIYGYEHANADPIMERISSPIYSTSTKKATNTYQRSVTAPASLAYPTNSAMNTMTNTLTVTDYSTGVNMSRPDTPAFPVTPRTPYGGHSINGISNTSINKIHLYPQNQQIRDKHLQQQPRNQQQTDVQNYSVETIYGTNYRGTLPLNSSLSKTTSSELQDVAPHLVKFAKDSSKFWYKPNLSREEAISLLINAPPGTFIVRDSTTYKNAYGLVVRVAHAPPGTATGKPDDLVRHFLIEPTTRGVRLKGSPNEPVFTSLSALVYEHSINQLALPCLLQIPERDLVPPLMEPTPAQKQLMTQGAACNVLWLFSCDTESLTGDEAIRKAIRQMYAQSTPIEPTEVHFKVTQQGITLTDNTRKKFFRKHYTADTISYCAIDPDHRLWTMQEHGSDNTTVLGALKKTMFAFVARCSPSSKDNQCHVFCDLAINQPASAIVSFVNKTLPTEKRKNYIL